MRVGIYKATLERRRGADVAVTALAEALAGAEGFEVALFERGEFAARMREPWDVVISTGTLELLELAAAFPRAFPWPVVQQFHTNPQSQFKRKRWLRNWRIRRALRRVAAIQVLSARFLPQVARYGVCTAAIGNWSAYFELPAAERDATGEPLIIYPAAFGNRKNQKLLVDAFFSISREFPEWKLELYGAGEPDFALPPGVKLMGYCDLREAYRRCSILAFPSLDEGFGLVVADAAAYGKPAVMVEDWIGSGAAGGAVVCGAAVVEYAAGLRRLMADGALRRRMGAQAREFCACEYSRGRILARWIDLLKQVSAEKLR